MELRRDRKYRQIQYTYVPIFKNTTAHMLVVTKYVIKDCLFSDVYNIIMTDSKLSW